MDNNAVDTNSAQYVVVDLGMEHYGIDISYVDNIIRMQKITRVPKAQNYYNGVINLRGEIVPVMSLRKKFELDDDVFTDKSRIIILKPENELIGIIVDSVKEVVVLSDDDKEKVNNDGKADHNKYISDVGKMETGLVSLLNINAIMTEE